MSYEDSPQRRSAAPYIAYQTLKTFIAPLKEHVVPNRIDKSLLRSFSGAVQAQLMTALRFLRLIEDDGRPTEALKGLVASYETEAWETELSSVLREAYPRLFEIPLTTVSPSEFNEAFKSAYPCEGETLSKGVRFFLNASLDAGIQLSPFLTKGAKPRSSPGSNGKRRARAPSRPQPVQSPQPIVDEPRHAHHSKGMASQLLEKFPTFDPTWPDEIKAKWFEGYERLLGLGEK